MMGPHSRSEWEEEQLGKVLDLRLLRRLLRYARPYWPLLALALLLSGGISVIELALPYITKVAVDEALVLPWVEIQSETPPVPTAIVVGEGRYLVREADLPSDLLEEFERTGALVGRWLLVPQDSAESEVALRHPDLFLATPEGYAISEENLKALPRSEVWRLRAPQYRLLGLLVLVFLGFLLLRFGLGYGQIYTLQYAGQRIMFDMRREIFGHLLRLPMSVLDREPVGKARDQGHQRRRRSERDVHPGFGELDSGPLYDAWGFGHHVPSEFPAYPLSFGVCAGYRRFGFFV
jgi:ATP-binding cassette subfamily B multidrug efflux pump